ncbi:hypothetical protein NQ314_019564, partial [Rhamnusium bicolor]
VCFLQVTDRIISMMKDKNVLFRNLYERKFYGGSYYDGIKVGKPEEYDLDFVLNLPLIVEPAVQNSDKPGFVNCIIKEYMKLLKRDEAPNLSKNIATAFPTALKNNQMKLNSLMCVGNYLSTSKVLQWMEKIMTLALNDVKKENGESVFDVTLESKEPIKIYVDKFLIVPKKPYGMENSNVERYWRLSFQEQERELIKGHEFKMMKPTIKLLKKLRDKQLHAKIASYYIKTIYLWEVDKPDHDFWKQSQSYVLMAMLKKYASMIQNKRIPYYWNQNYNLIAHLKDIILINIGNTLKNIIEDIESHLEDPFVIAKYLIDEDQIKHLRSDVDIGKKHTKNLKVVRPLSIISYLRMPESEETIRRPTTNDAFVQEISQPRWYSFQQPSYSGVKPAGINLETNNVNTNEDILNSLE